MGSACVGWCGSRCARCAGQRFLLKGDQTGARAVHAHPGISIKRVFAHPVLGRGGKAGGACAAHELVVGLEQARGPSRGGPLPAAAQSAPLAAALLGRVAIEASAVLRALVGRRPLPQSVVGALELRRPLAATDFWLGAHGEHNGRAQQRLGGRRGLRGRLDGAQALPQGADCFERLRHLECSVRWLLPDAFANAQREPHTDHQDCVQYRRCLPQQPPARVGAAGERHPARAQQPHEQA
ncbi:hypothetical protein HETIRDRAFT_423259 [Heterobasidion irregulare TC 32-1]|uniref:Uncharacterized protein n=1 Tax=Heterobasidion irregulare (strain TC 32-1) TaxID=747525 RepID=W4JPZ9_HETIT|nr:uncharacterized protein HETIRDRAFT_423259 [Heterobasidion irregulare TC 32-1]ETW75608.1 hypothetical protein HETIRDRAFT_423259 [Heterobasidion irregulare TC 32-1]